MNLNYLVTGSAGFIGSALTMRCLSVAIKWLELIITILITIQLPKKHVWLSLKIILITSSSH